MKHKNMTLVFVVLAILIVVISMLFLQKGKRESTSDQKQTFESALEEEDLLTENPKQHLTSGETPPDSNLMPTEATPEIAFSGNAAAALPQDELEYTLADPTPTPTDAEESYRGTRNDNPNLWEELELLIRYIRAELPGTWVGSFGDGHEWRLWLDVAYGNYELSIDGEQEDGTFTMEHRMDAFHTTMHMTPADETKEPYDLQICLANFDGEICLIIKDAEYPTFHREE